MNGNSSTIISQISLLIAVAAVAFLAWYIPVDRSRFMALFCAFHTDLPAMTKMVLSIPATAFQIAAGGLIILAVAVQVLARNKAGAALFHMLLVVLCCLVFSIYRESVLRPMITLIQGVSAR